MKYFSYTLRCAFSGRIMVDDLEADSRDVREYRRTFADAIQRGRVVETCIERMGDDDNADF